ncbi:sentrin-specific protease-like [Frankliniella occidentalis]|uniref:Sentrin-specific protease-like n=1 Tax=Frankliniella occidentalis TaxID=133901 RepID=A0A9C6WW49_FRAOC|nr:sentrin-specific protease-like [Frankliniella occidentalis]XP_052123691.1 sentrin-specific protease-like [Frankliniella occidentalis]
MGTKRERNAPKGYLNSPGLISVVSKYPVLWDFINHPNYTNSAARDAAWEKVAERFLDATPQECQTKWQSIKRALANSRRRQRIYEYSGAPADSKRKCRPYKYCKNLSFLDSLKLEEEDVQDGTMSGSENDTGLSGSDMEGSSLLSTETEHTLSIHEVSTALDEAGSSEELTTVIPNKAFLPFKNLQQNSQDYTPQQNGLFMAFKLEQALNKQQKQGRPKNGKVNPHIKEDLKTPIKKNKTIQNSREVEDYLDTTQEMSENDKENSPLKSPIVVVKQKKNKKKISPKIVLVEQPSIVSGGESDSEEEEPSNKLAKKIKVSKEREKRRELQTLKIKEKVKLASIKNNPKKEKNQGITTPKINEDQEDITDILMQLAKPEDPHTQLGLYLGDRIKNLSPKPRGQFVAKIMVMLAQYEEGDVPDRKEEKEKEQGSVKVNKCLARPHFSAEEEAALVQLFNTQASSTAVASIKSIQVTVTDFHTLKNGEWLNDMVINAYFELIAAKFELVCSLSSFFYEDLLNENKDSMGLAKNVPLFSFKKILIPICKKKNHWVLTVVDMENKNIRYYDSMNGQDIHCPSKILSYLELRKDGDFEDIDISQWSANHVLAPRQMNGYDCGVFVCAYARYEAEGAVMNFSQKDMPHYRKMIGLSILSGELH